MRCEMVLTGDSGGRLCDSEEDVEVWPSGAPHRWALCGPCRRYAIAHLNGKEAPHRADTPLEQGTP